MGDAELRAGLRSGLQETWTQRVDPAVLERYAAWCPIAGAAPFEYGLREIALHGGASVLAGIHFFGLDVARPFVGVEAQSRALTHAEIGAGSQLLCKELERFAPARVSWWSSTRDDLRAIPGAVGDRRLLAGNLGEIAARPERGLPDGFSLEQDADASCHEAYLAIYERLHRYVQDSSDLSQCEERASLATCAADGALFCLRERGRLAGVIAARIEDRYGLRAWYVVEQVLDAEYRGRGLAPALQRALLARLDRSRSALILGEINDRNQPSLRTALRVGRLDAGGWVFVAA